MPAEFSPVAQQSYVGAMLSALGIYAILIPLAALIAFVLTLILVKRGREPFVGFAIFMIAPLAVIVAIFGAIHSEIHSSYVVYISDNPSPNGICHGLMNALYFPLLGMLLACPSYAVAAIGTFNRAINGPKTGQTRFRQS